jgi:hypothetical protein
MQMLKLSQHHRAGRYASDLSLLKADHDLRVTSHYTSTPDCDCGCSLPADGLVTHVSHAHRRHRAFSERSPIHVLTGVNVALTSVSEHALLSTTLYPSTIQNCNSEYLMPDQLCSKSCSMSHHLMHPSSQALSTKKSSTKLSSFLLRFPAQ